MFGGMDSFPLLAIPFFIIAGDLMQRSGVLPKLIDFANSLVGHLRGGLAYVVVLTSMLFAGVTGVALAECAAIGSMLAPSMVRQGYPGRVRDVGHRRIGWDGTDHPAQRCHADLRLRLWGRDLGGQAVPHGCGARRARGRFYHGPGVGERPVRQNFPVSGRRFSLGTVARTLRGAALGLVVPLIIIGGILGGAFTPTEAGAVAMLYAVVIGVFVLRTLGVRDLAQSLLVGAKTSAIIYLLLATSNVVAWILVRNQVPKTVAQWSLEMTGSATVFMMATIAVLFLLGLALEAVPIMIMVIPVLAPAAAAYKIDPHHLGLVIVMTVQTALLSPPVALSLYVVATVIGCSMRDANREVWKFVAVVLAVTVITALWPAMPLAIPRLFGF